MNRLNILFEKYLGNNLTKEEFAEYWQLLEQEQQAQSLSPWLQKIWEELPVYCLPDKEWDKKLNALKEERRPVNQLFRVGRYAAAAVLIMALYSTYYLFSVDRTAIPESSLSTAPAIPTDVDPGTNGATLSFDNGKMIVLDTAENGRLTEHVTKTAESISIHGTHLQYATLITPRARQQQVTLADGTRVWLNAASSLRFPTAFTGKDRVVELTGEGYFEVAKDTHRPFIVKVKDAFIEVLGTAFNVMAYANESNVQTTLLHGAVKFSKATKTVFLKPGQQSRLLTSGEIKLVAHADLELATAWKNGQQLFRKADLTAIMRQVERWYNVDVVYQTTLPPGMTFTGELPRYVKLSELLRAFEKKSIHFSIDGKERKVTITQ